MTKWLEWGLNAIGNILLYSTGKLERDTHIYCTGKPQQNNGSTMLPFEIAGPTEPSPLLGSIN